jgi:hypothetical protein
MEGFLDCCEYTKIKYSADKDLKTKSIYRMVILEIGRYSGNMIKTKKEIFEKFPNTEINPMGVVLNINVEPFYYVSGNPPRIRELPHKYRKNIITKIELNTNPFGDLCSAKIDNYHPNADDRGKFCLGNLRFQPLSITLIESLIKTLSIYNLTNCYSIPDKELIKEV